MYSQYSKCFWKRNNTAWLFQGEPSSHLAVPTAAMCSVRGWDSNLPGHYCTVFSSSASNLCSHCYTQVQKCGFCCGETFEQHSPWLADEVNQWLLTLVYSHVLQVLLFLQIFKTQCIQKQPSHMRKTEQNTETCITKGTTYKHTKKITNFNTRCIFHSCTVHLDSTKVFLFTNWCTRELL